MAKQVSGKTEKIIDIIVRFTNWRDATMIAALAGSPFDRAREVESRLKKAATDIERLE